MKKFNIALVVIVVGLLCGCTGQKKKIAHNHDEFSKLEITHDHSDYFGSYTLNDENFGTKTTVTVQGDKRTMVTNAIPNHKTGAFPNQGNPNTISAQDRTYVFSTKPVYTGKSKWVREPGVALNGVKFEPGTAEVVVCESGENYRVEAFQDLIDLGLDFNNAHVQPNGAYHYHGTPTGVIETFDNQEDLVHVGFAHDGFPIYYSKSNAYKPSYRIVDDNRSGTDCTYSNPKVSIDVDIDHTEQDGTFLSDWEYVKGSGDLDECNGTELNGEYIYLVTNAYPYVGRCLMGEFTESERRGPPPGGRRPNAPGGGHPGKRPTNRPPNG
ncbi:YHYH protein [uncultured Kriegella sp.]|uniref:YHYH protein n=1 Tax=uncultured Kriegella sp. TaxID=1798910 RepID=UPI0030DB5E38|tara:strand:- start:116471 stop:117445 length:975 start_codon:yes stop_codon:yes gene_type:complete